MQHETVGTFTSDFINGLRITFSTQCTSYQSLCFTTGEQCRTMNTRQNTSTYTQCTDHLWITTVNTWFTPQNTTTYNITFQFMEQISNFASILSFISGSDFRNNALFQC
eukprot:RCo046530